MLIDQICSTQAPSLELFREKKQYEIASSFKPAEVNYQQNRLSK